MADLMGSHDRGDVIEPPNCPRARAAILSANDDGFVQVGIAMRADFRCRTGVSISSSPALHTIAGLPTTAMTTGCRGTSTAPADRAQHARVLPSARLAGVSR
jgi:hypothetical protein